MALGFSTVTVVTDQRRVDLALPSSVPLGEWMPELLRLCNVRTDNAPAAWRLGAVGGPQLGLDATLETAGVIDGQVLQLRQAESAGFVAYVDDLIDTVADRVDDGADRWTPASSTTLTALVAAGGLLALMYTGFVRGGAGGFSAGFDLVVAVAVSLTAALWARREHRFAAALLSVTALAWWTMTGAVAGALVGGTPFTAAAAAVGLAVGGGVLRVLTDGLVGPWALAWLVAALSLATSVVLLFGVPVLQTLSALIVVGVLILGLLPMTALGAGGLASVDYRIRAGQQLPGHQIERVVLRASAILAWALVGLGLVEAAAGSALALLGDTWPRALAVAAGLAVLLRSRAYTRRAHALPVRLTGAAIIAASAARLVVDGALGGAPLLILLAAVLVGLALLTVTRITEVSAARLRLLGNYLEIAAVIVLVPVLMQIFGLFAWVRELVQ
ncbi:MAG: type VII secretion integral membrane protein EccD [Streptosporangiales bacterium]